jgi:hypothetical protein
VNYLVFAAFLLLTLYAAWLQDKLHRQEGPPVSKPNGKVRKLSQVRSQVADAIGGDDVAFETDDGQQFSMPHPLFYTAAMKQAMEDAEEGDDEAQVRIMLGEAEFERFKAAGGDPNDVNLLGLQLSRETRDWMSGRPTQPSTSSGSTPKQQKQR